MPFTIPQLLTELQTDPAALGYAAKVNVGADGDLAGLINAIGATAAFNKFRNDITIHDVNDSIVPADFAALTSLQIDKIRLVFTGTDRIDANSANTRAIFLGIFSAMPNTVTALTAMATRKGSRAEVLWGTGTVVTVSDISFALRGVR